MVNKTQNQHGLFKRYYAKISTEYDNIVNNPHSQIKNDQKMVFGFGSGVCSILLLYIGIQYLLSFSVMTPLGLLLFIIGANLLKTSNAIIKDFF